MVTISHPKSREHAVCSGVVWHPEPGEAMRTNVSDSTQCHGGAVRASQARNAISILGRAVKDGHRASYDLNARGTNRGVDGQRPLLHAAPPATIQEPAVTETTTTTTTTTFKTAVGLAFGEVVKVVGSSDSLGNWDVEAAPGMCIGCCVRRLLHTGPSTAMTWGQGDEWTLELPLEAGDYSFKFVACNTATGECRWEGGGDRTITVRRVVCLQAGVRTASN